ncbi:unnamed protein product [Sympodiomycopsis kandeliae]
MLTESKSIGVPMMKPSSPSSRLPPSSIARINLSLTFLAILLSSSRLTSFLILLISFVLALLFSFQTSVVQHHTVDTVPFFPCKRRYYYNGDEPGRPSHAMIPYPHPIIIHPSEQVLPRDHDESHSHSAITNVSNVSASADHGHAERHDFHCDNDQEQDDVAPRLKDSYSIDTESEPATTSTDETPSPPHPRPPRSSTDMLKPYLSPSPPTPPRHHKLLSEPAPLCPPPPPPPPPPPRKETPYPHQQLYRLAQSKSLTAPCKLPVPVPTTRVTMHTNRPSLPRGHQPATTRMSLPPGHLHVDNRPSLPQSHNPAANRMSLPPTSRLSLPAPLPRKKSSHNSFPGLGSLLNDTSEDFLGTPIQSVQDDIQRRLEIIGDHSGGVWNSRANTIVPHAKSLVACRPSGMVQSYSTPAVASTTIVPFRASSPVERSHKRNTSIRWHEDEDGAGTATSTSTSTGTGTTTTTDASGTTSTSDEPLRPKPKARPTAMMSILSNGGNCDPRAGRLPSSMSSNAVLQASSPRLVNPWNQSHSPSQSQSHLHRPTCSSPASRNDAPGTMSTISKRLGIGLGPTNNRSSRPQYGHSFGGQRAHSEGDVFQHTTASVPTSLAEARRVSYALETTVGSQDSEQSTTTSSSSSGIDDGAESYRRKRIGGSRSPPPLHSGTLVLGRAPTVRHRPDTPGPPPKGCPAYRTSSNIADLNSPRSALDMASSSDDSKEVEMLLPICSTPPHASETHKIPSGLPMSSSMPLHCPTSRQGHSSSSREMTRSSSSRRRPPPTSASTSQSRATEHPMGAKDKQRADQSCLSSPLSLIDTPREELEANIDAMLTHYESSTSDVKAHRPAVLPTWTQRSHMPMKTSSDDHEDVLMRYETGNVHDDTDEDDDHDDGHGRIHGLTRYETRDADSVDLCISHV